MTRFCTFSQRLANNFGAFTNMVPPLLNMVDFAHRLVGPKPLEFLSRTLNKGTGNIVPTWNPYLPRVRTSGKPDSDLGISRALLRVQLAGLACATFDSCCVSVLDLSLSAALLPFPLAAWRRCNCPHPLKNLFTASITDGLQRPMAF